MVISHNSCNILNTIKKPTQNTDYFFNFKFDNNIDFNIKAIETQSYFYTECKFCYVAHGSKREIQVYLCNYM